MVTPFSFSFAGDDIEADQTTDTTTERIQVEQPSGSANAFPVQGKPLLPPIHHDLGRMLSQLPSKIAYSTLEVDLDGRGFLQLPRRELWDVRVQLMAEGDSVDDGDELDSGLGKHDVKTGIYEGGFKSWESSVDLVKVLCGEHVSSTLAMAPHRVIELGCGTALPSLALFSWAAAARSTQETFPLSLVLADYNPSVLYLVTLPNFLLAWAFLHKDETQALQESLSPEGELELTPDVLEAFENFLRSANISLSFVSGGWSPCLVDLLYDDVLPPNHSPDTRTLLLGAETIYSPFALQAFADTLVHIFQKESKEHLTSQKVALVAAKRLYFGVGGSLDDFVSRMRSLGVVVETLREETEGVRRAVVKCLPA